MSDFRKTNSKAEHQRIREMLSVYIDGELTSRDRVRVEEHLTGCADCTWELETLRQTVELVEKLPKVPVPHAFTIQETLPTRRVGLFQARWAYTYLKGATALAAALLILVLAGDVLFQFQWATTRLAPAMAPAKEVAAPGAAPTVIARQEAPPPAPMEAPIPSEEVLDQAEGVTYAGVTPSPPPVEETKTLAPMPTPTAPAAKGGGPTSRVSATATPLATPAPLVDKAEATGTAPPSVAREAPEEALEAPAAPAAAPTATPTPRVGKAQATGTPPPSAAMEVPAEGAPKAPVMSAAAPTVAPQPQMTATSSPAAPLAPASVPPPATPTPLAVATATATATPVPTPTPLSVARAPAEVRPTEEKGAWVRRPARPRLMLLRVVEASLCLLVMVLIAATLIVRRRSKA